jgi:hypothetical protein
MGGGAYTMKDRLNLLKASSQRLDNSVVDGQVITIDPQLMGGNFWTLKESNPYHCGEVSCFSLNGFGYSVCGSPGVSSYRFSFCNMYNDGFNSWIARAGRPIEARWSEGFALSCGYVIGNDISGLSFDTAFLVHRYVDSVNGWLSGASIPNLSGDLMCGGVGVSYNGYGYVHGTYNTVSTSLIQQYNEAGNVWLQVCSSPSICGWMPASFSLDGYLYRANGYSPAILTMSSVVRYDDATNSWLVRNNTNKAVYGCGGFGLSSFGYFVGGRDTVLPDCSFTLGQLNSALDVWMVRKNSSVAVRAMGSFDLNGFGYVCQGYSLITVTNWAGIQSSLQQYRDHASYNFPVPFKKSELVPKRILIGTSVSGRASSLPVQVSSFGSDTAMWSLMSSNLDVEQPGIDLGSRFPTTLGSDYWVARGLFPTVRDEHVGFALGLGYVHGGYSSSAALSSLYQYNDMADSWVGKQNSVYPCSGHSSWVLGDKSDKAFICGGTGIPSSSYLSSVSVYSSVVDAWVLLGSMSVAKKVMFSFAIGSYGYLVGGMGDGSVMLSSVCRYDSDVDTWVNLGVRGEALGNGGGFSLNGFGYVFGGYNGSVGLSGLSRFDGFSWTIMANYPRPSENCPNLSSFKLGGLGYGYCGNDSSAMNQYLDAINVWVVRSVHPYSAMRPWGFCVNNRGYSVGGLATAYSSFVSQYHAGLREYKVRVGGQRSANVPSAGESIWSTKRSTYGIAGSAGWSMNGYGYVYGGTTSGAAASAWNWLSQQNDVLDTVTARVSGGSANYTCRGFGLNGFGYVIGGTNAASSALSVFLQYNDSTNVISATGATRLGVWIATFCLNGYGYGFGGQGVGGAVLSDGVQYNDVLNTLTVKSYITRYADGAFTLNGFGYLCLGSNGSVYLSQTLQYSDATNGMLTVATLPYYSVLLVGFVLDGRGYIVGGDASSIALSTVSMFNDANRTWNYRAPLAVATTWSQGYSLNGSGYVLGGLGRSSVCQYGTLEKAVKIAATLMVDEGVESSTSVYPRIPVYALRDPHNLINDASWVSGSGSVVGFDRTGNYAVEDNRFLASDPWGNNTMVWEAGCVVDANCDGGWGSKNFRVDNTKMYRFSVWVKRTVVLNEAQFYFGPGWVGAVGVDRVTGVANSNPYFLGGPVLPALNTWYLVVGHILPTGSGTGAVHVNSGVYTINGSKVLAIQRDFVFVAGVSSVIHRTYMFYSTLATARQRWCYPRVDCVDGTEPSIVELCVGSHNDYPLDYYNLMSTASWTVGTGGVTGYNVYGLVSENVRFLAGDPWGNNTMVWDSTPSGSAGADGGWDSDAFVIDKTKMYRFSVWFNRTVWGNGTMSFSFGVRSNMPSMFTRSNGVMSANAVFEWGIPVNMVWCLAVGYVWPVGSGTGSNHTGGGFYTVFGGKIGASTNDFVWSSGDNTAVHFVYNLNCTDAVTRDRKCYPRVDCVDGTEPSIAQLLAGWPR